MPPAPFTLNIPVKDASGKITGYTSGTNEALGKLGVVVPNEPAVLSSRAGADAFQSKVQPDINSANAAVEAARTKRTADAAAKAAALVASGEGIPQDVLDELDAGKTPEERAAAAQLKSWDGQIKTARETSSALTLASKATAAAQINALHSQWDERKGLLEQSNRADVANWNQQFIRSGQAEYSPGMTSTFITGKEQEGMRKVKALDDEYSGKIALVNAALEKGNYELAATLTKDLNAIEDKALALMSANAKAAAEVNKKAKDAFIQSSREMTISDIVKQGITTAAEIQDYLNNTDAGEQVGDISLSEIEKVLKIVNPGGDLAGLDTDYRTFKHMQDIKDPIVDGLNYLDYKRMLGIASRKADEDASGTFKFSQTQQSQLLSGGFSVPEISQLANGVSTYGLDTVLKAEEDAGMDKTRTELIRRVFAGSDTVADITGPEDSVFTREYVSSLFDIADDETKTGGFFGLGGSTGKEQLNDLMGRIGAWQAAGYTDKEIQKELEKKD